MVRINLFGRPQESLDEKSLAIRSRRGFSSEEHDQKPTVELHPFVSQDGMIVRVVPPTEPVNANLHHVPCDIVLVIDVSGSMSTEAPAPVNPGETQERYGLSVLDLTKHAAKTILETLNENDRLGIVTFASEARVSLNSKHTPAGLSWFYR